MYVNKGFIVASGLNWLTVVSIKHMFLFCITLQNNIAINVFVEVWQHAHQTGRNHKYRPAVC